MTRDRSEDRAPRALWVPQATVFVSSFCIMVIELVAGRVISRHLGSSLYTWTSVIGVVLAGIAVGNYLGGRIADRRPARPTLAVLFGLASLGCIVITILDHRVGEWVFLWTLPWPVRVGTHVAIVFLVPSLILGMVSPVAAKMALDRSTRTGRTIGSVYAWGVVGSIAGTFATGFYLVALFGTAAVIWTVGGILALMGILFAGSTRLPWLGGAAFALLASLGTGPWPWAVGLGERLALREARGADLLYVDESQYSHIRVHRVSENPDRRNLLLDKLLHSSIVMERPQDLQYGYERIYAAITGLLAAGRDSLNTLTIGGGGYVFPRYLAARWPRSRTEVVEIDPAVTRAAIAAFGLPADHGFRIVHEDGRAYLRKLVERRRRGSELAPYDFIYLDVFDDYGVPYQLTTVEFLRHVDELLADRGTFLMNLIDVFREGRFIGSMISTMQDVFPHVAVFAEGRAASSQPDVRNTYILVGTKHRADYSSVVAGYDPKFGLYHLSESDLAVLRRRSGGRLLTDDWAPVENLLAPVVKSAAREIAADVLLDRARALLKEGRSRKAVREASRAIALHPDSGEGYLVLARAQFAAGDARSAVDRFREALRLEPSRPGIRVGLASALARLGQVEEAERQLAEATRREPGNALAHHNLGVILAESGRLEEAIASYERAVRVKPDYAEAYNSLGVALIRAGRTAEAIARFRDAVRIDPKNGKARQNLEHALARSRSPG